MATLESIAKASTPKAKAAKVAKSTEAFDFAEWNGKVEIATRWAVGTTRSWLSGMSGKGSPFASIHVDAGSDLISTIDASGLTIKAETLGEVQEYKGKDGDDDVQKFRYLFTLNTAEHGKVDVKVQNFPTREAAEMLKSVKFSSR